jgi:hypothetical protein
MPTRLAPPQLDPARKAALRKYYSNLEPEAISCRVTTRHWFPDVAAYGKDPRVGIEPVPGVQGAWQVATECHRCGIPVLYTIDRSTGHVARRGRIDYSRLEHYLWDFGDGERMTARDRDFLRSLQMDEAIVLKRGRDAKKRAGKKAEAKALKTKQEAGPEALVMDKVPEAVEAVEAGQPS